MEFNLYVYYIVVVSVIVFYCVWQYKRYEFVKKNSKCYKDLIEYNKKVNFHKIQKKINLYQRCNSKAQFDNFQNDKCIKFLLEIIEREFSQYKEIKSKVKENITKYDKYLVEFDRLVNNNPFDYDSIVKDLKMSAIDFRKIEVKICEKERLNPQLDIDIVVNVSYISPQGRNRYFKSKTINLDGLEYIFALRNQKIQYQKSAKYIRSSMTPKLRQAVFERDNFRCQRCGRSSKIHGVVLHVDHLLPVSKGGTNDMSNLQTLCAECNLYKSNRYNPNWTC